MTAAPRFVILHGWENRRPPEHWQHWLADELRARGEEVDYPQLPDPDTPDLDTWRGILSGLVARDETPVTLIAHSLAASLWLTHLALGGSTGHVTRVALVAIPAPVVLGPTIVAPFVAHPPRIDPIDGIELVVIEGEDDEYAPGGVRAAYAIDSGIPVERVARGGHLVPSSGFGPWPRILEWATGGMLDA
jgi:predicted alpha/beta hydrolase family esterase